MFCNNYLHSTFQSFHKSKPPYVVFYLLLCFVFFSFSLLPKLVEAETLDDLAVQANEGSVGAMLKLAQLFESEESEQFSLEKSFEWYLTAAKSGNTTAQRIIGAMYELGKGTEQDYVRAAFWYQKAADQGLARAQTNLGYLYENGFGVEQNYEIALALYEQAASQGYARGQVYLGKMHEYGRGVTNDFSEARHWYSEAAIQGYTRGQLNLGRVYEEGLGVERDYQAALLWYKKAATQGFQPAQEQFEKLQALVAAQKKGEHEPNYWPQRIFVPTEYVAKANELSRFELRRINKENREGPVAPYAPFSSIMEMECSDFNLHYLDREILSMEAQIEDDDPGLKFEAGYRFRDGDVDDDKQSAYAGLSWDIFNEGLLENNSQSKRFKYQREIEDIRAQQKRYKELFKCRDTFLFTSFNSLKKTVQHRKKEVLSQLFELSRKAYFLGDILADDLLKIEFETKKTNTILENYSQQNQQFFTDRQQLLNDLPEVVVPNLPAIVTAIETDSSYQKIAELNQEILEEKYDPLFEKRLRFFVKTGVNENSGDLSSGDVTAGVYFSTPLKRRKRDILPYKVNRARAQLKQEKEDILSETARLHNSYSEKYTDAVKLYYKLQTVAERLRRSLYISENRKNNSGTYGFDEHILVLRHLNEMLDTRFEYIAVQESLYRQLLHMFTLIQTDWQQSFIENIALGTEMKRGRLGHRSVYIWAKEFQKYDNKLLEQVFLAKGFSRAIISASKAINRQKLAHFIELARSSGISTELMVSENTWIEPDKWPQVEKRITDLCEFGQPIHLDIEPHTFSDYREKQTEYDTYFFDMVRKIRHITNQHDVALSIALPVLHDTDFVDAIGGIVDQIYVMAYGKFDQKRLQEKMASFKNINKQKIVLALRPSDFANEMKQEEFIDLTYEQSELNFFALHDLSQFFTIAGQQ